MRILAVDDDSDILALLPALMAAAGFADVTTAASAEIALNILQTQGQTFDCLCLDINMPQMDGIELCLRIRRMPAYRKSPILMLTAMSDKDHIDRAFHAGATDYVNKPFDLLELRTRLGAAARMAALEQTYQTRAETAYEDKLVVPLPEASYHRPEIEGFVDNSAIMNYVTQLSRAGVASSQLLAVCIVRFESIAARATMDELQYALVEAASAVRQGFATVSCLMAYVGKGAFVVVSHDPRLDHSAELEADIQHVLDEGSPEYDDGRPIDLEVSVGNAVRPSSDMLEWSEALFQRAIARAQRRAADKAARPRAVGLRFASQLKLK